MGERGEGEKRGKRREPCGKDVIIEKGRDRIFDGVVEFLFKAVERKLVAKWLLKV